MDIPSGIPRIIFARRGAERNRCQIEPDVTVAAGPEGFALSDKGHERRGGGGGTNPLCLPAADLAVFFAPPRGSITFRFVFVSSSPSSSSP